MQAIASVVARDRQVEDVLVEMPRAPLTLRLIALDAGAQSFAVENAAEILGLFETVGCHPIERVIDDRCLVLELVPPRDWCRPSYRQHGSVRLETGQDNLPKVVALLQ